uniref:Putative Peptidase M24 n=1 Tax=mine drainage metagenome TaxID=410659 RepID=E6QNA3_9ZZZZ
MGIQKDLVVNGNLLLSAADWSAEIDQKHAALVNWLRENALDGILLRRSENIAWFTGGAVELRVLTPSETGVASVLVTAAGRAHYLTTANEAPRLHDEEFGALDIDPIVFPWYDDRTTEMALEIAGAHVACDVPTAGFAAAHLYPLRASLRETEITRFRWLGAATGAAVTDVLRQLKLGMTEFEMEAQIAEALLSRGILPSVYLMAADERIVKYKHAVARGRKLEKYAMLNLCARKWGLTVSITRFAHFGPVPAELQRRFAAAAQVNAALLHRTRTGASSAELFRVAAEAYAQTGFPGAEQYHHQGGATGYWEREWVATPEGTERVMDAQAFAWNPSVEGGKVEDTTLLRNGVIELLTPTPALPALASSCAGKEYPATGVLEL